MKVPLMQKLSLGVFYLQHRRKILSGLISLLLIVTIRLMLPYFLLTKINQVGSTMNSIYRLEVTDLHLSFHNLSAKLFNVNLSLKKTSEKFIQAETIIVQVNLAASLEGTIAFSKVEVDKLTTSLTPTVREAFRKPKSKKPRNFSIEEILFRDSKLIIGANKGEIVIAPIHGKITNLGPDRLASYTFRSLSKIVRLTADGQFNPNIRPVDWDTNLIVNDFSLVKTNPFLQKYVPVTFTKGSLDLYFEGKSHKKNLKAYVKPFIHDAAVEEKTGKESALQGIAGTYIKYVLDKKENKDLGVRIPFEVHQGSFKLDPSFSLKKTIQQTLKDPPKRGIENLYRL